MEDRYRWKVLGVVVFGIFMVVLDTTVVNVAFPTIRGEFHATLGQAQWIVSLYVLALGITMPVTGYLGDRFGHKRTYLAGLALFVVGSLGSGLSPSLPFLYGTRALQGMGGGIALPLGTAMLFAAFPPQQQGFALGLYGVALLMAPALGPLLGGFLVDRGLWRWIFFINLPVGVAGVVLGLFMLREFRSERHQRADPRGLAAALVGFGATLYAASVAADVGWLAAEVMVAGAIGLLGLATLVFIELRVAPDPLLDFRLFSNRVFLNASLVGWVTAAALFGAEFLLPIYLQTVRGRTAFETGLILLPLAVVAGVVTPIAGRIYDHIGPRALVVIGFIVLCVNTWQLSDLTGTTAIGWILFLTALRGFALGNSVQSTYATALGTVKRSRVARGSSLINSTRFLVQALAVALFASVLSNAQSPETRAAAQVVQQLPPSATRGFGICQSTNTRAAARVPPAARARLAHACSEVMTGFERDYRYTLYFAIIALALAIFLPGWPLRWRGRASLQD